MKALSLIGAALVLITALPACAQAPTDTASAQPMGTGPLKAVMIADASLKTHTLYRPEKLDQLNGAKLPIIAWAEGGCANAGNSFRPFLTEIASHGYLVIAIGPIGPAALETTRPLAPGQTPPPPRPPEPGAKPKTFSHQLIDAIDWAVAQSAQPDSPYFGRLDTAHIAVMGQSCGGLQAIVASSDPRVTTSVIWNSGVLNDGPGGLPGAEATKASLGLFHAPVAYISGDSRDVAFPNANDDFARINTVPAWRLYRLGVGHGGTYREPNGGEFGRVAVSWLDWRLKGDQAAGKVFLGDDCGLCRDPNWKVQSKNLR
ncbi:MAG TPA: alpha/beta hydrolase [Caulobacteraceae bacterium]|nr:alpha/beta hydrolase [Caulobacteraceae bacterium]